DFCRRVDKRIVNRRTVEALARAGAFDKLHPEPNKSPHSEGLAVALGAKANRASLLASVGIALEAAEQAERNAQQVSLFGGADDTATQMGLIEKSRWSEAEQRQEEKAALGYYFSGHPFQSYRREMGAFLKTTLAQLKPQNEPAMLAGIIAGTR